MYFRRFNGCNYKVWEDMVIWCNENLSVDDNLHPMWEANYPTFYFYKDSDFILFLLMWGSNDK